jgi:hypothetical protein
MLKNRFAVNIMRSITCQAFQYLSACSIISNDITLTPTSIFL